MFAPAQCKSQLLSAQEQQLYGEMDRELVQDKMKATAAAMKTLVQTKDIDKNAKAYLLHQVNKHPSDALGYHLRAQLPPA